MTCDKFLEIDFFAGRVRDLRWENNQQVELGTSDAKIISTSQISLFSRTRKVVVFFAVTIF